MIRKTLAFAAVALCLPVFALAVPVQIPYSGQIAESGVLVNGTRNLVIRIYDAAAAGSLLDTETFNSTPVSNGVYHVMLAPAAVIWTGADRWLSVSVNGGAELTPRTQIGTVPYAQRAGVAEGLSNPPTVNFVYNTGPLNVGNGGATPFLTIVVNCPTAGKVSLRTAGYVALASSNVVQLSVSQNQFAFNAQAYTIVQSATNTNAPLTVSGVFTVSAGMNTFYLVASAVSAGSAALREAVLIAEYFPN